MNASQARAQLDRLFSFDAGFSLIFGTLSLIAPHGILATFSGGSYNHYVHETLRYVNELRLVCIPSYMELSHRQHSCSWWFIVCMAV